MAENPITVPLPADLPTNWVYGQTVAPDGSDVGLSQQHGYNYLMEQVNAAQQAAEELGEAFSGLASLDGTGKVPADELPDLDYDPAGSAAAVKEELEKVIDTKAVKSYGVLSAANVLTWAKQQDGSGAFNVNPTVTTEGVPTAAWYSGFLEKSADGAYKLTLTRADNGQTFVNVTYAQEWIGWIELATVDELADKVGLAGNVSELGDMNLANIANQFYVIMESDAIQNLPYNSRSFNNSVVYNRGQENAVFTQTLYTPQLKAVYQRYYIGWWPEESRWSEWEQIATITSEPSTAGARAISAGTTDLTAGSSALATGQIYLVYG